MVITFVYYVKSVHDIPTTRNKATLKIIYDL